MFTELFESFDSSILIPSKEEVDLLINKLENNEDLTLDDELVLNKVGLILHINKERLEKYEKRNKE